MLFQHPSDFHVLIHPALVGSTTAVFNWVLSPVGLRLPTGGDRSHRRLDGGQRHLRLLEADLGDAADPTRSLSGLMSPIYQLQINSNDFQPYEFRRSIITHVSSTDIWGHVFLTNQICGHPIKNEPRPVLEVTGTWSKQSLGIILKGCLALSGSSKETVWKPSFSCWRSNPLKKIKKAKFSDIISSTMLYQ